MLRVMFRQRVILLFQFGEHQSRFLIYWMATSDACRGYIFSLINLIIFSFSSLNWLARPPLLKYVGYLLFVERIKSSIFLLFSTPIILITTTRATYQNRKYIHIILLSLKTKTQQNQRLRSIICPFIADSSHSRSHEEITSDQYSNDPQK